MGDKRLVLLRHGQTSWNAIGRAQGHADIELDETGHEQAAAAAVAMAELAPTRLWSSDLARATQTAAYVGRACGLDPVVDPRLREYDVGQRTGLTLRQFADSYPDEHTAWQLGNESRLVPGAETTADVRVRVAPALSDAWDALGADETGIVVLHGACLRVGLLALLRWPWELGSSIAGVANCGWVVLTADADTERPRLTAYNRIATPGVDFTVDGPVG